MRRLAAGVEKSEFGGRFLVVLVNWYVENMFAVSISELYQG